MATSAATAATRTPSHADPVPRSERPPVGGRRRHRRTEACECIAGTRDPGSGRCPIGHPTPSTRSSTNVATATGSAAGPHPRRPLPGDPRVGHRGPGHLRGHQPAGPDRHAVGLRRRRRAPAGTHAPGGLPAGPRPRAGSRVEVHQLAHDEREARSSPTLGRWSSGASPTHTRTLRQVDAGPPRPKRRDRGAAPDR